MLHEYDPFLVPSEPANPWISDSTEFWEMFEKCTREQVAERRVLRWGFSCWELLKDPVGHDHFKAFLEKEYATENLLFVEAVWRMKKLSQIDVAAECQKIWMQFLASGAEMLVNVDSKSHKITRENMETHPDRYFI
jgi:regulator of G-protein signaling